MKVDRSDYRELLACAAILAAILSGKLQVPVGGLGIEPSIWTEIRLWMLPIGTALLIPEIRSTSVRHLARPVVVCLSILLAYLFGRSFFDVEGGTLAKRIDLVYLFAEIILVSVAVLHAKRIAMLAYTLIGLALVYLAIAVAGQIFPALGSEVNFGLGWGPVGGPITFNRVQFLAFCVAMCLARGSAIRYLVYGALGCIFLFATIASLQKAALLSAALTILFIAAHLLWNRRYIQLASLLFIGLTASTALLSIYGDRLSYRIERLTEPGQGTPDVAAVPQAEILAESAVTPAVIELPEVLPADTGSTVPMKPPAPIEVIEPEPQEVDSPLFIVPDVPQPTTAFTIDAFTILLRYCVYDHPHVEGNAQPQLSCPAVELNDRSTRLVFWAEAVRAASRSPIVGNGIGSFQVTVVNNSTMRPDTYPYPHNLILEIASEAGAVGVVLLFLALFAAAFAPATSPASVTTRIYVMAFMVFLFLGTMFSGDFYDSRLLWLGAITLTFWKAADKRYP